MSNIVIVNGVDVTKLLELYKEINDKRKELITLARYGKWSWKLVIEINEIQDKIKELENA